MNKKDLAGMMDHTILKAIAILELLNTMSIYEPMLRNA